MDRLARDQDIEAIKILKKLREEDRPWSDYYQKILDNFMIQSSLPALRLVVNRQM